MAASIVVLSLISMIPSASAWTQLLNYFDSGGTGYCGTDMQHPCLYWQEPHNTSIDLYFSEDSSLWTGSFDFRPALSTASITWNGAPAWNPYVYFCSSCSKPTSGIVKVDPTLSCNYPAITYTFYNYSAVGLAYNIPGGGQPNTYIYYSFITSIEMDFNPNVHWNYSGLAGGNVCNGTGSADGYNVAAHESGHLLGVGHTWHTPALMWPGVQSFHTLQNEDITAIENIYPGNQPSTCC